MLSRACFLLDPGLEVGELHQAARPDLEGTRKRLVLADGGLQPGAGDAQEIADLFDVDDQAARRSAPTERPRRGRGGADGALMVPPIREVSCPRARGGSGLEHGDDDGDVGSGERAPTISSGSNKKRPLCRRLSSERTRDVSNCTSRGTGNSNPRNTLAATELKRRWKGRSTNYIGTRLALGDDPNGHIEAKLLISIAPPGKLYPYA